jgi:hypothetical protein
MMNQEEKMIKFMDELLEGVNLQLGSQQYPYILFFVKDNQTIMYQDTENGYLWIGYDKIWSKFSYKFSLIYTEIKEFMRRYVALRLNLRVVTPNHQLSQSFQKLHLD